MDYDDRALIALEAEWTQPQPQRAYDPSFAVFDYRTIVVR